MKINNYITHLELRRKSLRKKYEELQLQSAKAIIRHKADSNFDEITKLRSEIKEINGKLKFLLDLRKGITNENNRVQETSKRR